MAENVLHTASGTHQVPQGSIASLLELYASQTADELKRTVYTCSSTQEIDEAFDRLAPDMALLLYNRIDPHLADNAVWEACSGNLLKRLIRRKEAEGAKVVVNNYRGTMHFEAGSTMNGNINATNQSNTIHPWQKFTTITAALRSFFSREAPRTEMSN